MRHYHDEADALRRYFLNVSLCVIIATCAAECDKALIPRLIFREKYFARKKISSEIKIKRSSTLFAPLFIQRKNVNKDVVIRHIVIYFFASSAVLIFFCILIGFAFRFSQ